MSTANRIRSIVMLTAAMLLTVGCSSFWSNSHGQQTNSSSLVNFLYPNGQRQAETPAQAPTLHLPLKVGLAFVPQTAHSSYRLSEAEKNELLQTVRAAFVAKRYVASIEIVPDIYLRQTRGFAGMEQLGRLHGFDVMALVSYDQVFGSRDRASSLLYWTIVGAYVVPGTSNSVHTFVDTAVFDLDTRQLLFRAPGTDQRDRRSTAVESDRSKASIGAASFESAMDAMIPNLDDELERFSTAVRNKERVAVVTHRPGYGGGGSLQWPWLIGMALFAAIALTRRQ